MAQKRFIEDCKSGDIQTLRSLDYSQIDIHSHGEAAFRWACGNGYLDVIKFLLTLEPDHGRINIHAYNEEAFVSACQNGHLDVVKFLLTLEHNHGRIDIHAADEHAFRRAACHKGHLVVVKFLLTLEPDHGRIDIHTRNEYAFRLACKNAHLDIVKFLLSLEPDHGRIDIHADSKFAFRNGNFHIRYLLIRRNPEYDWKNVYGYEDYLNELNQIVKCLSTLHQKMIQIRTDILELNVIGIIKDYLI